MEATEKTELSILSEISRISNSYIDLPEKLARIVEVVARGMGRDGASVFLIDRPGKTVTLSAAIGLNQESIGKLSFPARHGHRRAGWPSRRCPLALEDPYTDPRFQYIPESGIEKFQSLVAAPIMDEDRCLGVIFVLSLSAWRATSSELTLLITTANQISGVIKSAQLFHNIQERLSELATIYEIGMALTSTLDLEQLLSLIARNSTQSLRAQGCTIRLMNLPEIVSRKTYSSFSLVGDLIDSHGRPDRRNRRGARGPGKKAAPHPGHLPGPVAGGRVRPGGRLGHERSAHFPRPGDRRDHPVQQAGRTVLYRGRPAVPDHRGEQRRRGRRERGHVRTHGGAGERGAQPGPRSSPSSTTSARP